MWARTNASPTAEAGTAEATAVCDAEAPAEQQVARAVAAGAAPRRRRGERRAQPQPTGNGRWEMPPLETLVPAGSGIRRNGPDNAARSRLIVDTLASFGVDAEVVQINEGPTVTQFGVEPGWEIEDAHDAGARQRRPAGLRPQRPSEDEDGGGLADAGAGEPDNVAGQRPGAGAGDAVAAHRGAGAGEAGRRHRGAERHDVAGDAAERRREHGVPAAGGPLQAGAGAGQERVGRAGRGGPGEDAAPAHRRRDGQRQERLHQLDHHLPADAVVAGRRALRDDRPEARGAGGVRADTAPGVLVDRHRRRQGGGHAAGGDPRDGEPLPALRVAGGAEHRGVQPPSEGAPAGCPTGS